MDNVCYGQICCITIAVFMIVPVHSRAALLQIWDQTEMDRPTEVKFIYCLILFMSNKILNYVEKILLLILNLFSCLQN